MRQNVPDTLTIIPARMAATRLPGKPLRLIGAKPMIVQVWQRAMMADIGRVIVACDGNDIADVIKAEGGEAVITDPALPSGSDRVAAALAIIDPNKTVSQVINLQGDLPEMKPEMLAALAQAMAVSDAEVITPVAPLKREETALDQVVKAVVSWPEEDGVGIGRAHYFSRAAIPFGGICDQESGEAARMWHHVGVYGWQREALDQFVKLKPSPLEKAEKLEQLRALEAGMQIAAIAVDNAITGIDTETDLTAATLRISL
jgi:3-deoxy-manno-octulosonate cytidylyltransferase (CMP-KDO synthetase)